MSAGTNKERIEQNNTLLEDIKTQVQNLPEYQDTSDANATSDDILSGKTAYLNGEKIFGWFSLTFANIALVYVVIYLVSLLHKD